MPPCDGGTVGNHKGAETEDTTMEYARFDYASFRKQSYAEAYLEHLYASGLVCEGEHPEIEKRGRGVSRRFVLTMAITAA